MQRFYRIAQLITATSVALALSCHLWIAIFPPGDSENSVNVPKDQSKGNTAESTLKIVQWRQGYLEAIDNRRIVMHETSGRGCLTVRQSCAVESAAKHNPDRPVQLLMRQLSTGNESQSDTWLTVLRHYNNVEIIQLLDESQYFNNTALFSWYLASISHQGPQDRSLFSEYFRSVSLFRGGGLLLDLDNIITIKPLDWWKWNNFFVIKRDDNNSVHWRVNVKMLHLLHGHHLIDEIILNMANFDLKEASNGRTMAAAIEASVKRICGLNEPGGHFENRCLDVRLVNEDDVFLPSFLFRRAFENEKDMVKKAVESHAAAFVTWDSIAMMKRHFQDSVCSSLLAEHCPFTIRYSQQFPPVY